MKSTHRWGTSVREHGTLLLSSPPIHFWCQR